MVAPTLKAKKTALEIRVRFFVGPTDQARRVSFSLIRADLPERSRK
jgi:hypothetical protein